MLSTSLCGLHLPDSFSKSPRLIFVRERVESRLVLMSLNQMTNDHLVWTAIERLLRLESETVFHYAFSMHLMLLQRAACVCTRKTEDRHFFLSIYFRYHSEVIVVMVCSLICSENQHYSSTVAVSFDKMLESCSRHFCLDNCLLALEIFPPKNERKRQCVNKSRGNFSRLIVHTSSENSTSSKTALNCFFCWSMRKFSSNSLYKGLFFFTS